MHLEAPIAVVGVAASAGGLNAFKSLLSAMSTDSGLSFVLVPHLDPKHESLMVDLLERQTEMPVSEAEDGVRVRANCIYVIPPNRYLTIEGGVLHFTEPESPRGYGTAIDLFLRSLATDQKQKAVGIILSGTGNHGTLGLNEIKLAGGMVMAQHPDTADYDQMPRSAIDAGLVDYVLAPEKMPEELIRYAQHPYVNGGLVRTRADAAVPNDFPSILALLGTRTKLDFRFYRKNMLARRVHRRMGLRHVETIPEYLAMLRESPEEISALEKDLLIGVTGFFRESEAFHVLEERVVPELVDRSSTDRPVRVWVAGCSTGEEAYSIAILLLERFALAKKAHNLQIFASDVDERALEVARAGTYPPGIAGDVTAERLRRYFVELDDDHYRVNPAVRESVTFAAQNLITDAPFSKLDLVSCRNLLIYLEPEAQRKVVSLFHFALREDGCLFLGSSETIGRQVGLFEPISKKWRIYRRIGPTRHDLVDIRIAGRDERLAGSEARLEPAAPPRSRLPELMRRLLVERFAPASVLISPSYEVLSFEGPTVNFLEFPSGEPTQNLMTMARPGLRTKLRAAVHRAKREGGPATDPTARVRRNGAYVPCTITVTPLKEPKAAAGMLLVTFTDREAKARPPSEETSPTEEESSLAEQLEHELKATREDLQSTIEELESSNEELKASNEEVMSMNEELATVNSELRDKVDELDRANNDVLNLLNSTDIAAVFLDTDLRIRRFTAATGKLLHLLSSDIGRPFRDFSLHFIGDHLLEQATGVLGDLVPVEKEIRAENGRSYLRRILPYRTHDNHVEGVVVTFVDITVRVQADTESRRLAAVLRDSNDAVTVQDLEGRITAWNRGAERMYGYSADEAKSMNIRELVPESKHSQALELLERVVRGKDVETLETQRIAKDGRVLQAWLTATPLRDECGEVIGVATTERDITRQRAAEIALDASEVRFRLLAENVPALFSYIDTHERYLFVNKGYERAFHRPAHEIVGLTVRELLGDEGYETARPHLESVLAGRETTYEIPFDIHGAKRWMHVHYLPELDDRGNVKGFFALIVDRTEEKQSQQSLEESRDRLASVLKTASEAIVTIDETGTIDGFNPAAERMFGWTAAEAIGQNVSILMPEPHRSEHDGYIQRYLERGEAKVIGTGREVIGLRKDGTTFPIDLAVSGIDHQKRFTGIIRDVTERKRAETALEASREELRALSARLLSAEETERRRLSRELHDDINQRLAMLAVDLQTLSQEKRPAVAAASVTDLRARVAELSDDVHSMAYRVHPAILDDLGLAAAVSALAQDFHRRHHQIEISLRQRHFPKDLAKNVASCLYRVAQESLTNIVKHSDTSRVDIVLAGTDRGLRLAVRDYGQGFDVQAARNHRQSLGIVSMQERVRIAGGTLAIWSFPGKGTRIRVTIPFAEPGGISAVN